VVEVESSPEPTLLVPGLSLQAAKQRGVADVRRHGGDVRIAPAHDLRVGHDLVAVVAAEPDVGQQPSIAVAGPHVELEANRLALDERAVHRRGGAAAGLLALPRVVELGRVDPDVAHGLPPAPEIHLDRVAVDGVQDDRGPGSAGGGRATDRRRRRNGHQEGHQQQRHLRARKWLDR
jgi:hypothetical protein